MAELDIALLAAEIMQQDEEEQQEEFLMLLARIVADAEALFEWEEGGNYDGAVWVPITVFINEYHTFGDPCFNLHFRMSRGIFEVLVNAVRAHLVRTGRLVRERTPFIDIMLMVVWILATPDTFRSVALRFGVRPTTLHYFYSYVIEALREMAPAYISWPNEGERAQIKQSLHRLFPGVVGIIDGTHIQITAPLDNKAAYVNRHHQYSINVQAVVDNNLLVRDLHVGEAGSLHDRRVFRRSSLHRRLLERGPDRIINEDEHILGDGGYVLTDFMMIPFRNNGHLNAQQMNFNRQLSQIRVRVEHAFARAKGKWRRLKYLFARNPAYVVDHITASFVLHNFVILNGEPMLEEDELMRPIDNNEILGNEGFDENEPDDEPDDGLEELEQAAQMRGFEKRLMYMNDILPQLAPAV